MFSENDSTLSQIILVDFIFRAFISPVVAILGILGNILAIIVFFRSKENRFAIYSAILALVNIFILFLNTLLDDFLGRGIYFASNGRMILKIDVLSLFSCRFMGYVPNVLYCVSSYIIVVLSIDRCMVLAKPMTYTPDYGTKSALIICLIIFLLSIVFNLPTLMTYNVVHNPNHNNTLSKILFPEYECSLPNSTLSHFGLYWKSVVTFAIPTGLVICLNAFIIVTISYCHSPYRSNILRGINRRSEQSKFIGQLAVSCLFIILFLPLSILIIMRLKYSDEKSSPNYSQLKALSKLLSSVKDISYAGNILLYLLFMPHFRNHAKQILCCITIRARDIYILDHASINRARSSLIKDNVTSILS